MAAFSFCKYKQDTKIKIKIPVHITCCIGANIHESFIKLGFFFFGWLVDFGKGLEV